jgi:hypothetical protein
VAVFGTGTPDYNVTVLDNIYNGNTNLLPSTNNSFGYVSTNSSSLIAPDGFVFFQSGGNYFVARNTILNNQLEGVQMSAGPSSVVGNTYSSLVSCGSGCALALNNGGFKALGGYNANNYSACFIGNSVYGGRNGNSPQGQGTNPVYCLNFSGNELTLYPPFPQGDYPGAAALIQNYTSANVFGNNLVSGGLGFRFVDNNGNALVLNNNFTNVTYRGIGYYTSADSVNTAQIFGNTLDEGVSFHVQLPYANSFGWFLGGNTYLNASTNSVSLFMDPLSSAVHIFN